MDVPVHYTIAFLLSFYPLLLILANFFKKLKGKGSESSNYLAKSNVEKLGNPPSLPFLGHLHYLLWPNLDLLQFIVDMNVVHGPVFHLNFPFKKGVMINDPACIQKILLSTNPGHLSKDSVYKIIFEGKAENSLFTIDYEGWRGHRQILKHAFTYKSLTNQLPFMNEHAKLLVSDLADCKDSQIDEIIHCRVLKLSTRTIMETEMFTDDQFHSFCADFAEGKKITTSRLANPWQLIPLLWFFHPSKRRYAVLAKRVDSMVETAVAKYRSQYNEISSKKTDGEETKELEEMGIRPQECMMPMMIRSGMSDSEIVNETMGMLFAGHEPTSLSIMFTLLRLALMPEIQLKCQEEVDILFSSKPTDELTMEDLTSLKYLERCILESLRLQPVVPLVIRSIEDPVEISPDVVLPVGTSAYICPYAVHHDPKIYQNPEIFDPDRFLPENCKQRHPYAYLAFSAGPRNCIGWKNAIMTLKTVTAHVLRHYKIRTSLKGWEQVQLDFQGSVTMKNSPGLSFDKRNFC